MKSIEYLFKEIKYNCKDSALFDLALTHSSYAKEAGKTVGEYNERLEFLGDSVLSIVISDYLYKHYPKMPEGKLTKFRAIIVCEPTLASIAKKLDLGAYMRFSKGERLTGGATRISILADALEALIAALYLDGGMTTARRFILSNFDEAIKGALNGEFFLDYKSALQEKIQAGNYQTIKYEIIGTTGPDHLKQFKAQVLIDDIAMGEGTGKSKKEAHQMAAKQAIKTIG